MDMKTIFTSPGKWISVKDYNGYMYSERNGVDSVAVVAVRSKDNRLQVMLHSEGNPAHYRYRLINRGVIGGSMDKGSTPLQTAREELREEGGYDCSIDRITPVGKMFCTTQSSEHVYLFVADVTGLPYQGLDLEPSEKLDHGNKWNWFRKELFDEIEDPRFIVTLIRYFAREGICF